MAQYSPANGPTVPGQRQEMLHFVTWLHFVTFSVVYQTQWDALVGKFKV